MSLAVAAGAGSAADGTYTLALHLEPRQVFAYDGTYRLQVLARDEGKDLILASLSYGLVFTVETVDADGASLHARYDRMLVSLRGEKSGAASEADLRRRIFRFRLSLDGRVQGPVEGEEWPDGIGWRALWSGWPGRSVAVGECWRTDDQTAMGDGSRVVVSRDCQLTAIEDGESGAVAVLSFTERGTAAGVTVGLPEGRVLLEGSFLSVGEARFDLGLGLPARVSAVSILTGQLHQEGDPAKSLGEVRLGIEIEEQLRKSKTTR